MIFFSKCNDSKQMFTADTFLSNVLIVSRCSQLTDAQKDIVLRTLVVTCSERDQKREGERNGKKGKERKGQTIMLHSTYINAF